MSKLVPPAVRITWCCAEAASDGTTKVSGTLADCPAGMVTGDAFSHAVALAGLTEKVTLAGAAPAFFTCSGVIV